jgi:serine phosphatase RsbU (regulator of sigma subunit)
MMFKGVPTARVAACPKATLDKTKLSTQATIFFIIFLAKLNSTLHHGDGREF